MCQYFLPFKGLIVFHLWRPWTVTTFCFISSAVDGYLGVFHLLAVVNNTAMSRVSTFFKFLILLFLGIYPEVALLDLMAILCLIFLKTPPSFLVEWIKEHLEEQSMFEFENDSWQAVCGSVFPSRAMGIKFSSAELASWWPQVKCRTRFRV
jgi:hypothetical protein